MSEVSIPMQSKSTEDLELFRHILELRVIPVVNPKQLLLSFYFIFQQFLSESD